MATTSDSEDESFVELGRALPFLEVDGKKKPISLQDAPKSAKDSGRQRFHGAFTGGFSAGYFNSVGSKEGWTPSTFVSSRTQRQDVAGQSQTQRPEDFMDEEDFGEHGIAPRKFATSTVFTSEERNRKRHAEAAAATRDTVLPSAAALVDLIVPEKIPMGIKLLRKMGWKEGQGIGPRVKRKQSRRKENRDPSIKVYGCMLPPTQGDSESSDSEIDLQNVTFAPKDVSPISLASKDNVHGLGYRGLDPRVALPATHVNLFEPPPVKSAKSRKGIRGQAFGVGALEEDDEDIYAVDSLSNYDQTMEMDDSEQLFGWTAPGTRRGRNQPSQQKPPVGYVGKLLEGFTLSAKPLPQKKVFPQPTLPQGFKPFHRFKKTPQQLAQEAVGETSSMPHQQSTQKLTAVERGVMLGETPIARSVFDLIPKEDVRKMDAVKEAAKMASSRFHSAGSAPMSNSLSGLDAASENLAKVQDSHQMVTENRSHSSAGEGNASQTPLFQGNLSLQPFRKDPAKQERYERYLALVKQGVKEPHDQVTVPNMTEWERQRERDEFAKAAKIYRPLSNMMASRFTRGAFIDDSDHTSGIKEIETAKSDQAKAAEMKMYGQLTHKEFEWHPHNLLCKRFNVPNPYPGSEIVGLLGVKRDKFSVFNFLTVPSEGSREPERKPQETPKAIEASNSLTKQLSATRKKPGAMSIFSVLEEKETTSLSRAADKTPSMKDTEKDISEIKDKEIEEADDGEDRPDVDLFRAIFKNSDSESSSSSEKSDEDEDKNAGPGDTGDVLSLPVSVAVPSPVEKLQSTAAEPPLGHVDHTEKVATGTQKVTSEDSVPQSQPAQPQTSRQKSRSRWGGSIFDVLDQSPPENTAAALESSVQERLHSTQEQQPDDDTYGPALPPPSLTASVPVERTHKVSTPERHQKHKHREKDKERSRHHHKKEKKKKSKHKKEKKKKKEKKSKRTHRKLKSPSSGSEADTETDSESA